MAIVLVSDPIADKGIELLEEAGFDIVYNPNPSDDELQALTSDIHAWVVRSGTKITAELLKDARNLQVIGRAGVGVDNIDIQEATNRGVVVMNNPDGNTISVTAPSDAYCEDTNGEELPEYTDQSSCENAGNDWYEASCTLSVYTKQ